MRKRLKSFTHYSPVKLIKRKLKNGITLVVEQRDLPVVALSIANRYGASYETSKIKGIAHFIEHLVFTGTKTRTHEDISREIEKKGGILNAFTSNDVTAFWFKLPSEHLFAGLDILTDMLNNPLFEITKFEKEKKVIIEEIKMYHDTPTRHIYDKIAGNLYGSPFGDGIIGSEKTINALTRDFVANHFHQVYNPANYIVTAVGKVNIPKLIAYLEKNFKPSKSKAQPLKVKKINRQSTETRPGLDQAHFIFATHAPMARDPARYALEVLDAHLAGSAMSSQLFLKIREERGLAYTVKGSITVENTHAYYTIYVGTRKEAIPQVKAIILEEFKKARLMTPSQLKEAKERLIGLRKISMEESVEVMNELLFAELTGKAEDYYSHVAQINKVTLADIKKAASIKDYSTASIVPK